MSFDREFHEPSCRLRIDADLGKFCPLAFLVDPQHGTGSDGAQREAPGKALAVLQTEFDSSSDYMLVDLLQGRRELGERLLQLGVVGGDRWI